jgi:hypothetical protein
MLYIALRAAQRYVMDASCVWHIKDRPIYVANVENAATPSSHCIALRKTVQVK